jgi:hypothetical membrane protein
MDFLKSNYNIISTVLFVFVIVIARIFSTYNYDWTKNTISDLGSQGYERKLIMQFGFFGFWADIIGRNISQRLDRCFLH